MEEVTAVVESPSIPTGTPSLLLENNGDVVVEYDSDSGSNHSDGTRQPFPIDA